jgi:hypothetical protein
VPIARLHVDDLELDFALAAGEANVEVLAASVRAHVDPRLALPGSLDHRQACARGGKAPFERLARHGVSSLAAGALLKEDGPADPAPPSIPPAGRSTQ